ncbi:MAG TPA: hypothetical protein VMW91_12175 [Desulfosporosinus sp.]|nr:hypothetical protein [Desulfosporosinus sp.]
MEIKLEKDNYRVRTTDTLKTVGQKWAKEKGLGKEDWKLFEAIAVEVFQAMVEELLDGEEVVLPNNLGKLHIGGNKPKDPNAKPICWAKTKALWREKPELTGKQFIYFMNFHSDQYIYRFRWAKTISRVKFLSIYRFKPSYLWRRSLKKNVNEGYTPYNVRQ